MRKRDRYINIKSHALTRVCVAGSSPQRLTLWRAMLLQTIIVIIASTKQPRAGRLMKGAGATLVQTISDAASALQLPFFTSMLKPLFHSHSYLLSLSVNVVV